MLHLGDVPANSTLYIPFQTFNNAGASVTLTGLAVTDIEIYKNGSVTQRASDNGYALLDTDGIDFDAITGIHGFSVDLSDNTTAGFYSVGGFFWVVVSAVTVDAQTVNFIAATFRIVAAEAQAGYPKADADYIEGVDATNQIRDAVLSDATRIGGANLNTLASHDPGEVIMGATDLGTGAGLTTLATAAAVAAVQSTANLIDGKTTNLPTDPADQSLIIAATNAITAAIAVTDGKVDALPTANANADALLDRTDGVETSRTLRQTLRLALAVLCGKASGMATATAVFRDSNDSKNRVSATVDEHGNRSAVTLDAS